MTEFRASSPVDENLASRVHRLVPLMAAAAMVIGISGLAGWVFDIPLLTSISPSFPSMKPNSAVGIICAAIAVVFLHNGRVRPARLVAIFVTLLGLATLVEHAFGWDLGFDNLLFSRQVLRGGGGAGSAIGRSPASTGLFLACIGAAVLVLAPERRRANAGQALSLVVVLLGVMSLTGYLFGVTEFTGPISYSPMAVPTGVACLLLGMAAAHVMAEQGWMRVFLTTGLGGMVARRLLPTVTLFPIVVGFVRVTGERLGLYPTTFGVMLTTIVSVVVLAVVVASSAVAIDRLDAQRNQAHADLALVNRAQRHFIAGASHELRTPLTSIMGYLELLPDLGDLSEEQRDALNVVDRNTTRLYRLVDSLLQMLRRGDRPVEIEDFTMADLATEALASARLLADTRNIEFQLDIHDPGSYRGDREQLSQVLDNLISNAVKYSRPGGSVVIAVERAEGSVRCSVTDSGIGIAPDDLDRLFDPFFRARDATARGIEGSGLGLSIVKTIVEKHGGQVSAQSRLGEGSTFSISLPEILSNKT